MQHNQAGLVSVGEAFSGLGGFVTINKVGNSHD